MLALGVWMLVLVATLFHLGLAETAISYCVLDELTVREGTQIQRINGTTITMFTGSRRPLEVRQPLPEDPWFLGGMALLSVLSAGTCGVLAVVVFPHWKKIGYAALVLTWPLLAAGIVLLMWQSEAPHLLKWGLMYICSYLAIQLIAGLAGVTFGRPFARLMVRIFLPPSIRPRLAYLWYADGQVLPPATVSP